MTWINLDGAVNVRDVGGLPLTDGGVTAGGRLLRADNLQELSAADVTRLVDDIGVTTVVDLRSTAELMSEGPAPLDAVAGVRHAHHPVVAELGAETDVMADVLLVRDHGDRSDDEDPLTGHYLGYLADRPAQVVAAVRSIAASPGAALVHCAAGKDRTGMVVALTLSAVGVRREAVVADYVATGERVDAIIARLRRTAIYAADVDSKPATEHMPRPATMSQVLTHLDARYGGAAGWLAAHGFGDDELIRLRGRLRSEADGSGGK
jgi:protein-tyrosine phosphatase